MINILFGKVTLLTDGRSHQLNPVKGFKEGCHMIIKGIKKLVKTIEFTGVTINIGIIGLNFTGGFSKENINYRM